MTIKTLIKKLEKLDKKKEVFAEEGWGCNAITGIVEPLSEYVLITVNGGKWGKKIKKP